MKTQILIFCLFFLTSCSSPNPTRNHEPETSSLTPHTSTSNTIQKSFPLDRESAAKRAKQIGKIHYKLKFTLPEKSQEFFGDATIQFDFKDPEGLVSKTVHLDLNAATIETLKINGQSIDNITSRYSQAQRLIFQSTELFKGQNTIQITYKRPYSRTGNGLHRFDDPEDGSTYLYTNFEPYAANQLFPCFDQPDLKATFQVSVEAPSHWEVIANTLEQKKTKISTKTPNDSNPASLMTRWSFPTSDVISTYVFALHAGPYASWRGSAESESQNPTPLRLFARKTMARYIDPEEWFDITRRGIKFFSKEFGTPLPYKKYDQILVPEFNAGAMENVAAVTFSERFIFRSRVTEEQRLDRADVILHELAHMWFGNLVTMRWWNGLWLNESFATWAAGHAAQEATRFGGSKRLPWRMFFSDMKRWAYSEDQLPSTHPIETSVPDTDQAFANFDGITYGKGASTLKQLRYSLGDEAFREGLVRYFSRYALRNTTLADFMNSLSEASGQDLTRWQKLWLQVPGLNSVEADWVCDNQTLSRFTIKQRAPAESAFLRPHATEIALYNWSDASSKQLVQTHLERIVYAGAETEINTLIGKPCPVFVFPNQDDHDYVKILLDRKSLDTLLKYGISKINNGLTRQMVWHTLWEMVLDAKLEAQRFLELALLDLPAEKDPLILRPVINTLFVNRREAPSALRFVSDQKRNEFWNRMEAVAWQELKKARQGSDLQLLWWKFWTSVAISENSKLVLHGFLVGKEKLQGFVMEQDRRWEAIDALSRLGDPNAKTLIAQELERDKSDMGRGLALAAETKIPSLENKKTWFSKLSKTLDASLTNSKLAQAMRGFQLLGQEEFTQPLIDEYLKSVSRISRTEDEEFSSKFVEALYPANCEMSTLQKAKRLAESDSALPPAVKKSLIDLAFDDERCIRARKLDAEFKPLLN